VTPAQAKTLLPLWQAFQGSALQNQTEQNAVLKQIEGALTAEQLKAIAAMQLTQDDLRKWMEESGMQGGQGPAPRGTPGPGGRLGAMTEEQRAAFRATVEASGGRFPGGGQGPRASGTPEAGGPGPAGQGRFFAPYRIFLGPLVELMTQRAAE
jgi:hypothetical protein